ncbi:MAG: PfkB family carbohydrate kinase [Aeoliella sp.]
MGGVNVILTLGSKECGLATDNGLSAVPAFEVQPVDTTAVGDAFYGALASALAQAPIRRRLQRLQARPPHCRPRNRELSPRCRRKKS